MFNESIVPLLYYVYLINPQFKLYCFFFVLFFLGGGGGDGGSHCSNFPKQRALRFTLLFRKIRVEYLGY